MELSKIHNLITQIKLLGLKKNVLNLFFTISKIQLFKQTVTKSLKQASPYYVNITQGRNQKAQS